MNIKLYNKLLIIFLIHFCFSNQLRLDILSYNIYGLNPIFTKDKSSDRIKEIFEVSRNYDIIFYQENWFYQDLLYESFNKYNIIIGSMTKFIKKNNPKRSSGLNVIIKEDINIHKYAEHSFSACNGWLFNYNDCLATKGFIYSEILIENNIISLYNTHLDAGKSKGDINARARQLEILKQHIQNLVYDGPIIICGDFNINYYNDDMINLFIKENGLNILQWDDKIINNDKMIDYILYKNSNSIKIEFLDYGIQEDLKFNSDHPPIEFTIIFNEVN